MVSSIRSILAQQLRLAALASALVVAPLSAQTRTPLSRYENSRLERIAVVSVVGQTFTRQYAVATLFGNEREQRDIAAWNLDAAYEEQAAAALQTLRGVAAVKAPHSAADFRAIDDLRPVYDGSGLDWSAVENPVRKLCAAQSLDAVLLIARARSADFQSGSHQFYSGAGFYVRGADARAAVMHLVADVGLLRCDSAALLAERRLSRREPGAESSDTRSLPMIPYDADISRLPVASWTPGLAKKLRADLVALPAEAWAPTLRGMFPGP